MTSSNLNKILQLLWKSAIFGSLQMLFCCNCLNVFTGPKRAGLQEAFKLLSVRTYVRPSPIWLSCIIKRPIYLGPPRFWTPYKITTRGVIRGGPDPPNPPYGWAKVLLCGLLPKDHSHHQRVKYFWEAPDLEKYSGCPWGVFRPPWPLTPNGGP